MNTEVAFNRRFGKSLRVIEPIYVRCGYVHIFSISRIVTPFPKFLVLTYAVQFPGVHQNIGGGYPDQGMSNITLAWMMSQVESFIDFNEDYILEQYDETHDHYKDKGEKPRPWSFGKIYRSMIGIYLLGGRTMRTPGRYDVIDPTTGRPTDVPLRDTCEYVHPSARTRIRLKGPGVEDEGVYDGHPLDDYKLRFPEEGGRTAIWQPRRGTGGIVLPESPLYRIERALLNEDRRMAEYLLGGPAGAPPPRTMSGALTPRGKGRSSIISEPH